MIIIIILLIISIICLILHYIEKYQNSKLEQNNCEHDFVYIPRKLEEYELYSLVSHTYYRTCRKCGYSESIEIFN